jgi:RNA polymerase sigma-B factor
MEIFFVDRPVDREDVSALYRQNVLRHRQLAAHFSFIRDELDRAREAFSVQVAQCRKHQPQGGCACLDPGADWRLPEEGRTRFTHHGSRPAVNQRTQELMALHRAYAADGDAAQRHQLVAAYDDFARALARDFHTRRESLEDLIQVARLGLVQAIDRFDPSLERPFVVFARATIVGELKRHVRDRTWSMRVPRSLQEHYLVVVRAVDELTQELGRSPAISEVAGRTGLSGDHVLEAMELGSAQRLASLDAPLPDGKVLEPGVEDPALDAAESRAFVTDILSRLPEREQRILELRFREGLSQTEIGTRLGVSQMYVSRMLSRTLSRLRVCAQSN